MTPGHGEPGHECLGTKLNLLIARIAKLYPDAAYGVADILMRVHSAGVEACGQRCMVDALHYYTGALTIRKACDVDIAANKRLAAQREAARDTGKRAPAIASDVRKTRGYTKHGATQAHVARQGFIDACDAAIAAMKGGKP